MKLNASQLKDWRLVTTVKQGFRCAICTLPLLVENAVADHNHKTGALRGACHRGCNGLEGRVQAAFKMCPGNDLPALLRSLALYLELHTVDQTGHIYPSHGKKKRKPKGKK